MPGPARQPDNVRNLRGNPSKDEAQTVPGTVPARAKTPPPEPPADLSDVGRAEWARVVDACGDRLGQEDYAALLTYVSAWERHEEARRVLRDVGQTLHNSRGDLVKNPATQIIDAAVKVLAVYGAKFGLSPRDRQNLGLGTPDPDAGKDPFAA